MTVTVNTIVSGGGGGGSGSSTYAGLTDAATVNLPVVNTPLATALAALSPSNGTVLGGSFAVVPVSTSRGTSATATIPANFMPVNGYIDVYFNMSKTGTVDLVSGSLYLGAPSANVIVGNAQQLNTVNAAQDVFCRIYGNGVDQTSVQYNALSNASIPFGLGTLANNRISRAVNTANAWTVSVGLTTSTTETATTSSMFVVRNGSSFSGSSIYPTKTFSTIAFSSTPTITYTNYANFDTVLTANTFASTSFTESGLADGMSWTWTVRQDATGGWQPAAWPASFFFLTAGGAAPTVPTTATTGILVLSGVYNANFNGGKTLVSVAYQT